MSVPQKHSLYNEVNLFSSVLNLIRAETGLDAENCCRYSYDNARLKSMTDFLMDLLSSNHPEGKI